MSGWGSRALGSSEGKGLSNLSRLCSVREATSAQQKCPCKPAKPAGLQQGSGGEVWLLSFQALFAAEIKIWSFPVRALCIRVSGSGVGNQSKRSGELLWSLSISLKAARSPARSSLGSKLPSLFLRNRSTLEPKSLNSLGNVESRRGACGSTRDACWLPFACLGRPGRWRRLGVQGKGLLEV